MEAVAGYDGAAHGAGVYGKVAITALPGFLYAGGEQGGVKTAAAEPFHR